MVNDNYTILSHLPLKNNTLGRKQASTRLNSRAIKIATKINKHQKRLKGQDENMSSYLPRSCQREL